ncbi:MAG: hypothetical protein NTZ57_03065, partial [Deltaproteobacteria bacterium]|nr:hypothetical protein [Deltaproteobacteria bacterium]
IIRALQHLYDCNLLLLIINVKECIEYKDLRQLGGKNPVDTQYRSTYTHGEKRQCLINETSGRISKRGWT